MMSIRTALGAGFLLALLAGPAAAQYLYPSAEETNGIGTYFLTEERGLYLVDVDEGDTNLDPDTFGRDKTVNLTEVGLSWLLSGNHIGGQFQIGYLAYSNADAKDADLGVSANLGMAFTAMRLSLGADPEPGHPHYDTVYPKAPFLYFGVGFDLHPWYVLYDNDDMDMDVYGGEAVLLMFAGIEVLDGVNVWAYANHLWVYITDDGMDEGQDLERLYEEDQHTGFGLAANVRISDIMATAEVRLLNQFTFTFTLSYLFGDDE